jgi:hypothetical protein
MFSTKVVPFAFMAPARLGNDESVVDARDTQNTQMANYIITPPNQFNINRTTQIATSQPGVMFSSGALQSSPDGANIDLSSAQLYASGLNRPPGHINLTPRIFATVPYLGRGTVDTDVEQVLRCGQSQTSRPSVVLISEKNFSKYSQMPLLPELQQRFADSSNYIEQDANPDWVRGGINAHD